MGKTEKGYGRVTIVREGAWKVLPKIKVCTHCRRPALNAIAWHKHHFHLECAKKLLIVAQMSLDELTAAVEAAMVESEAGRQTVAVYFGETELPAVSVSYRERGRK